MTFESRMPTALITGASGGIGREIVRSLNSRGFKVACQYDRGLDRVSSATTGIDKDDKLLIHADFLNSGSATELWASVLDWVPRVDVVVLNAGLMPEVSLTDNDELWDSVWKVSLSVNLIRPMELMRRAVSHFQQHGGGTLITISSWAAQRGSGNPKLIPYAASKAGIATATKTIARAYAKQSIAAYCIAPGPVATGMTRQSVKSQGGEGAVLASLAMGEFVPPHEIAELVGVLASGKFKHLSGATIDVNGASYIR